jgi:hypothetical protein
VARLAVLGLVQLSLIGGGPVWITARGRVDAAGADGL